MTSQNRSIGPRPGSSSSLSDEEQRRLAQSLLRERVLTWVLTSYPNLSTTESTTESTTGSAPSSAPGSASGSPPGSAPSSAPSSAPGSAPGSPPGSSPGFSAGFFFGSSTASSPGSSSASSHDSTASLSEASVDLHRVNATTDLTSLLRNSEAANSPEGDLNSANIPDSLEPESQAANQATNQSARPSLPWTEEPNWSFANIRGVAENSALENLALQIRERATSLSPHTSLNSSSAEDSSGPFSQEAPSSVTTNDYCLPYAYPYDIGLADPENESPEAWATLQRELGEQGIHISNPYDRDSEDDAPEAWAALQRQLAEQGIYISNPYGRDHSHPSLFQLIVERIIREEFLATPSATNNQVPIVAVNGRVIEELEDDISETASGDHTNLNTTQTNISAETQSESAAPFIAPGFSQLDQRVIQSPWNRTPTLQPRSLLDYNSEVTATQFANEGIDAVDRPRLVNPLFPRPGQVTQAQQPNDVIMARRLRLPDRRAFTTTPIPVNQDGARRVATDSQILGVPRLRRVGGSGSLRALARSQAGASEAAMTAASEEAEEDGAPAQEEWRAPEDHWSSDEEDDDEEERVDLDEVGAPGAEQLRAGLAHLSEALVQVDVLDGDLPAGADHGNRAAIRARANLVHAEGEIMGAVGQLWRAVVEAREDAVDAQARARHLQDEVRNLTTAILAVQMAVAERLLKEQ
ncbi:uncharacterized protein Z520_07929 [Fonsecaea multimorphosa CBS 102226]|uniref:Uncharacterized protein n=1 Tax=Fonsecaea multimorphosa CBS 102226 TaxID=1442371 RepID=A0A0D2IGG5_9EURO|nr:uncharacterized protein Z520_07929 [Fonsecaea multimorphosa CBS 102226]KIX96151.1 hypothetical protein Z520_07929 [Fonsecaea multimorphosa CBS 102226]OAL22267.1 hypothetical protein AYO22_07311 [Fonsecaea multimorphosa]